MFFFVFFKRKSAYELRISDWSSDVCSSDLLQAHEAEHLQHLALALLAVAVDHADRHVGAHLAALDSADADQAEEVVVVQMADAHLEQAVLVHARRRNILTDCLHQPGSVGRSADVDRASLSHTRPTATRE